MPIRAVPVIDRITRLTLTFESIFMNAPSVPSGPDFRLSRWVRRASRAARLRPADWAVVAESFWTVLIVGAGLKTAAFPRLLSWATRVESSAVPPSATDVSRLVWLASLATRVTWFKCLARSLALARLLGRRGIATDVQIGVRADATDLKAHAWVEWRGRILNDSVRHVSEFVPLDRPARLNAHV
jgi:Transglutaminase-like superfamily